MADKTLFLVLYAGDTIASARVVAGSTDPELLTLALEKMAGSIDLDALTDDSEAKKRIHLRAAELILALIKDEGDKED